MHPTKRDGSVDPESVQTYFISTNMSTLSPIGGGSFTQNAGKKEIKRGGGGDSIYSASFPGFLLYSVGLSLNISYLSLTQICLNDLISVILHPLSFSFSVDIPSLPIT